jgi:hypothetical protein
MAGGGAVGGEHGRHQHGEERGNRLRRGDPPA